MAIFCALLASGASADSLRQLVREGNVAFATKNYDAALQKYRSAQVEAPESPYLYYNIAAALQQQGKHDEAMQDFQKVYTREQPSLGAWALYNMGVSQYRQAEEAIAAQDLQKALGLLESAMQSNREAMKIDPTDEDPKFNYEQAKRKWKEVLDELKKQQEQQKQNQQNQDQQKKDEQKQDQQKDQQQNQDQQKQDPQQSEPQKSDEQKKQEEQKKAEQQKQQQAQQQQQKSGGEQDQQKQSGDPSQAQPVKAGEMTPDEAQRLLNSLPEQNARDLQRFLMRQGGKPYRVEKNW